MRPPVRDHLALSLLLLTCASGCQWQAAGGFWRLTLLASDGSSLWWPSPPDAMYYDEETEYMSHEQEDYESFGYTVYDEYNLWVLPGEQRETQGDCTVRRGMETILDLSDSTGRYNAEGRLRIQRWTVAEDGCGTPFETVMDETFPASGALTKYGEEDYDKRYPGNMRLRIKGIGGLACGWPPDPNLDRNPQEPEWQGVYDNPHNIDSDKLKRAGIECRMTEQYVIFRELEEDEIDGLLYRP